MKKVSLNRLKQNLPGYAKSASEGEVIEVTKYNRPYFRLVGALPDSLILGKEFSSGNLKSTNIKLNIPLKRILEILNEDRE